jgi:hypothetical protein
VSISPRKLANGKTVYDVYVYMESRDDRGRRRKMTRTAHTKQEAIRLEARLKVEAEGGGVRDSRRTVADLMAEWIEAGEARLSPVTTYRRQCDVARYVLPALGTVKLDRLNPRHLDRLLRRDARPGSGQPDRPEGPQPPPGRAEPGGEVEVDPGQPGPAGDHRAAGRPGRPLRH